MVGAVEKAFVGLVALLLSVACVCSGAFGCAYAYAAEGVPGLAVAGTADLNAQALSTGDAFSKTVEGVDLVFQVVDVEGRTAQIGPGGGAGNGLAAG